jgi:ribosomal protein S18 acetylase RimI-like enzyme
MPSLDIRPMTLEDRPVLFSFSHSYLTSYVWQMERLFEDGQTTICFREIRLPREVQVEYPRQPERPEAIGMDSSMVLVAVMNNTPVGYISLKAQVSPNLVQVTDLIVSESQRRQGIASGLIIAAQDWAAAQGLQRIVIEIQSKNYPAIQLANKTGYEFCGYHDHYYSNHDIALFFARFLH